MADEPAPKMLIRTENAPGYHTAPCSGVFGGITPTGQVFVNMYHDTLDPHGQFVRDQDTHQESRVEGAKVNGEAALSVVRTYECGFFLTPTTARSIADWLRERADEIDESMANLRGGK